MRDLFATAACSLAPVDEDGGRLEFVATAGAGAELVVGMRILAGWGIAGWVLASGQPIELRDVARDLRLAPRCRRAHRPSATLDPGSASGGQPAGPGVLEVLDRDGTGDLDADQGQLLVLFAGRRHWQSSRHACSPTWLGMLSLYQSWPHEVMSCWHERGAYVAD